MTGPYTHATWRNTIQAGPGAAQRIIDDLEYGPRIATPWASGRYGCVGGLSTPDVLARLNPSPRPHYPQRTDGQMSLLEATS